MGTKAELNHFRQVISDLLRPEKLQSALLSKCGGKKTLYLTSLFSLFVSLIRRHKRTSHPHPRLETPRIHRGSFEEGALMKEAFFKVT